MLLDAHAIIHRAYHALPDFQTRDGRATGGLYGVCTMLIKIVEDLDPDYVIACYDLPGGTFRHDAYDDYKAGRAEADDALVEQIKSSRDIFDAFSIPIYDAPGYEADDVLGTLAEILKQDKNNEVIIATGDMDTLQLVDEDRVRIFTPKKSLGETILYDEDAVVERYGFASDLIPDYKGLSGDPSDNIIGIKGIGAKTATTLITNFGTVEEIYEKLEKDPESFAKVKITPRIQNLLREGKEEALFSKELAIIKCDVPFEFSVPKQTFVDALDFAKIGDLFRSLEFRSMLDRLKKVLGIEITKKEFDQAESGIDTERIERAKLSVHLLNPTIAEPGMDDVFRYSQDQDFKEAESEIQKDIEKEGLGYVLDIELSIFPLIQEMNKRGFLIDVERLQELSKNFSEKIVELEKKIHNIVGEEFNIKSTQQLSTALFETLGLPTTGIKKTPKGVLSTKESELEKLQNEHEIIALILEYRELTKLTSTYIDNIIPMVDEKTKRLHTRFIQTGTTTGRMSSKDPNLQNIPTSSEYGRMIREAFIATPGTVLVSADYSQIELRVAAMLSQDEKLLDVFKNGRDIHTEVSKAIFGDESPESRRKAKVINFGILYGMGATALRKNLNNGGDDYSLQDARAYLDKYFDTYSGLAQYLEHTKESAKAKGYTETIFGRRRYFPELQSKAPFIRAMAERMALNAPIQGTATGDIVKIAMRNVAAWRAEQKMGDKVFFLGQVHDELLFEIQEDEAEKIISDIKKVMESVLEQENIPKEYKQVPLLVSVGSGKRWSDLK